MDRRWQARVNEVRRPPQAEPIQKRFFSTEGAFSTKTPASESAYLVAVDSCVIATGVLIRLATEAEAHAAAQSIRGRDFHLDPPRSFNFEGSEHPLAEDEVFVVGQAFAEFDVGTGVQIWHGPEFHGYRASTRADATMDLLSLAEEAVGDGLMDLLAGMGIAGLEISRWQLMSAPRRIDLSRDLQSTLAPLRRH